MPYVVNLDDSAFTAESFGPENEPFKARLADKGQWCPAKREESWLQINIGKVRMYNNVKYNLDIR